MVYRQITLLTIFASTCVVIQVKRMSSRRDSDFQRLERMLKEAQGREQEAERLREEERQCYKRRIERRRPPTESTRSTQGDAANAQNKPVLIKSYRGQTSMLSKHAREKF
jgi:hypothetical protein